MAYVNATQAARELGKSEKTIRRWIQDGKLEAYHPHGQTNRLAIPEQEIERLKRELDQFPEQQLPGPAATEDMATLSSRVTRLEQEVARLAALLAALPGIDGEASLSPRNRATELPQDLPSGSVLIKDFAALHNVNARTFYDQVKKGIPTTERAKVNRPREVERWLSPEQQSAAIQFWLDHGTAFSSCPDCPHGNSEYASILSRD